MQQRWTSFYKAIIIVIVPALIYVLISIMIFTYIRNSFRIAPRIYPIIQTNSNEIPQVRIHRQDIRLLRHMICTFFVFVGGWCPIFLLISIDFGTKIPVIIYIIFTILAEASLLFIIINLFRYNQKLRHYLINKILRHG